MKRLFSHLIVMLLMFVGISSAQLPVPVSVKLGLGGGITLPGDEIQKYTEAQGWNAGAKVRISSLLPVNLIGSVSYHRIKDRSAPQPPFANMFGVLTEPGEGVYVWMIGAGVEYSLIPLPMVSPYIGIDGSLNIIGNTKAGSLSFKRTGVGLGGGVEFSVPTFGSFDASVKYQILNAIGNEEETLSQVAVNLTIMYNVL